MVKDAVSYLKTLEEQRPNDVNWMLVGKGPTAAKLAAADGKWNYVSLNHACTLMKPVLAHFIDLSAWADCSQYLAEHKIPVALPWHPNVKMHPMRATIRDHAEEHPLLKAHLEAGLVFSYNATTCDGLTRNADLCRVRVRYFSAVAAFNLLAYAGVKEVYSLGVDGGKDYAPCFDAKDKLANGRPDFDIQFKEIEASCKKYGVMHIAL